MAKLPKIPRSMLTKLPPGFKKPRVSDFKADMERLGEELAEEFKDRVIENIENNSYGYSLDPSTVAAKGSDTPLIDSGEMVDSIYAEGSQVSVEDTPRDDSQLTNLELAITHEYGVKDKGIPARPVWRQTFEDFRKDAQDSVHHLLNNGKFKDNGRSNNKGSHKKRQKR